MKRRSLARTEHRVLARLDAWAADDTRDARRVIVQQELVARDAVVPEIVAVVTGDDEVRLLEDAQLLGRLHDRGVRVVHAHQALAAPSSQIVDQHLIVGSQRRLARNKLMETRIGVVVVGDARRGDPFALIAVPVRRVGRSVRAVRSEVEEEGPAGAVRAGDLRSVQPLDALVADERRGVVGRLAVVREVRGLVVLPAAAVAEVRSLEPPVEALRRVEVGFAKHADIVALLAAEVHAEGVVLVQRAVDVTGRGALQLDRRHWELDLMLWKYRPLTVSLRDGLQIGV